MMGKSQALYVKAKKIIPGGTQLLSKRPELFSLGVWPAYYQKAKGAEVLDLDGNKYVDMSIGGIGANVLGYADPDVNKAVKQAIDDGSSSSLNCAEEVELAQVLCRIHPWAEQARFARCGGEAMAVAVRIARALTRRDTVAICGYHGWHDWYLAANLGTENALGEHLLTGLSPTGVPKALKGTTQVFRYNDLESLERLVSQHKDSLAAIIMEPIRNVYPQTGFLEGVCKLARKNRSVLIFDEVSSGFRMNAGGAHLILNAEPDIAVFSKAMGNGYPIAAIIGRKKVMEAAQSSFISSTMWTERIGPVAALATIRKFQIKNVAKHLMNAGKRVQEGWAQAAEKAGLKIKISGIYPLSHFAFDDADQPIMKAYFIQEMLKEGYLASNLFYSMFAHTDKQVEGYLIAAEKIFKEMSELLARKKLSSALKGQPASSGFKRLT
ncbi:MAG: aminotransferase class III-fold pyridoxal phosphate-dependent enzyme [Candidatus Omnitrophica bacterium]|nr:aminotransferase class III-fold pyridoxal phosphate-dependent enzyme [Candidatus Omnitrophota bacterium]